MAVDYSGFLQVEPDGSIWWPLGDAVKLAAGYLPLRHSNTQLFPELRALNNQNVLDAQRLLREFGPDRLTDSHPPTQERGRVKFVEAHEFLNWLWKYCISNSQATIPMPHALASVVSNARSAEETGDGEAPDFNSLTMALEDWFGKPLDELPVVLQLRVRNEYGPGLWDGGSAAQRRAVALQRDLEHDPAQQQGLKYWSTHFKRGKRPVIPS